LPAAQQLLASIRAVEIHLFAQELVHVSCSSVPHARHTILGSGHHMPDSNERQNDQSTCRSMARLCMRVCGYYTVLSAQNMYIIWRVPSHSLSSPPHCVTYCTFVV
jgi:hypothetical protein